MSAIQSFTTFPATPPMCFVTAANTASDGSGSLVTLWTVGASGGVFWGVKGINAQATAAASSGMVCRVFITDASGANPELYLETALAAATRSTTAIGATFTTLDPNGFLGKQLKSGQLVQVCQSVYAGVQDKMCYQCLCADY